MRPQLFVVCLLCVYYLSFGHCDVICKDGYTCFEDEMNGVVWVMKDVGNVNGPNCFQVCQDSLCASGSFYQCKGDLPTLTNSSSFNRISQGLGFSCKSGGCWDSQAPGEGMMMVSIAGDSEKSCYFPQEATYNCQNNPGNANCYGERYSLVCPCVSQTLNQACPWDCPPHNALVATWPTDPNGTSCLDRINYWRKRACEEGWPECPPCGLPPMVECIGCHECANSQAQFDKENGAHASFRRCGDRVQGEGGGRTCADVIDSFVSERQVFPDSNGTIACRGHCGPIVAAGCQTFFWGRSQEGNFYTLNWRSCNVDQCDSYCSSPTDGACFHLSESSPVPSCFPVSSLAIRLSLNFGFLYLNFAHT